MVGSDEISFRKGNISLPADRFEEDGIPSPKLTAIPPKKDWLEDKTFAFPKLGWLLPGRCKLTVSFQGVYYILVAWRFFFKSEVNPPGFVDGICSEVPGKIFGAHTQTHFHKQNGRFTYMIKYIAYDIYIGI